MAIVPMVKTDEPVEDWPEIALYFTIENFGSFMHTMQRAIHRGDTSVDAVSKDLKRAYDSQTVIANEVKRRFEIDQDDHDTYKLWYRWWNAWHKHELSDEEWKQVDNYLSVLGFDKSKEDSTIRPKGTWRPQLE